jgi:excisionase family DNA binding protein
MGLPDSPQRPLCVRVDQALHSLGIGKTKLYELIGAGELETIRIGRRTLVLQASLEDLVERLRRPDGGCQAER